MGFMDLLKPLLGPILEPVLKLIPDVNARAEAKERLEQSLLDASNAAMQAQITVNTEEAKSASVFVAGWRPFVGWVCGFGLGWAFVFRPLLEFVAAWVGRDVKPPALETGELMNLLVAMLGLAGYRTFEKMQGVADNSMKRK